MVSTDYDGPAGLVAEFRDAAGNEFNVVLSNVDAPEGLTKLEVCGVDRVNLLGSVCSALARLDISIVSGIISTGNDGIIRNTMYVRRAAAAAAAAATLSVMSGDEGDVDDGRIEEDEFVSVSLQVLSACWTSDRKLWVETRQAGKFLSSSRMNLSGGTTELAVAEARMRAVSARLADAAERLAMTRNTWSNGPPRMHDELLSEMEDAVSAVAEARSRAAVLQSSQPGGGDQGLVGSGANGVSELPGLAAGVDSNQRKRGGMFASVPPLVKGFVLMNLASVLFGSNQVVIKQVVDSGLDNFSQLFLRFGFAIIPLLPFVSKALRSKQLPEMTAAALELGTILSIGYLVQIIGLDGTTSARGALTSTFTVLTVPIFAGMAGQLVPWYTWPASLLGLAGVGLLTNSGGEPVLGDVVCILSAIIFGYHTLQSSKYAPRFEDQELPFIALQIGVVVLEAGVFKIGEVLFEGYTGEIDFATYFSSIPDQMASVPWLPLAYMGFFTTSFTLYIEFLALQNVSASLAALIYTAEPLWGAVFAWNFMGDRWGPVGWVGTVMIIGASVGSQLLSFREDGESGDGDGGAIKV